MGGPGSGNFRSRHGRKKRTVEAGLSIDAARLTREEAFRKGALTAGSLEWAFPGGGTFLVEFTANTLDPARLVLELSYSWALRGGEPRRERYAVPLTTTRPRLGGLRWWFACPLAPKGLPCRRRVGKLHLPPGELYFGCRRCHDLTYTSCQESGKYDRLYRHLALSTGVDFAVVKGMARRRRA